MFDQIKINILKVESLEADIKEANRGTVGNGIISERPKTAEQLLSEIDNDEDDETEEITDTISICESTESEFDDLIESNKQATSQLESDKLSFDEKLVCVFIENFNRKIVRFIHFISLFKAFIPCAAHSLQNVIKDGLNFSTDYLKLIKKVSKKIVSKSKFSHLIAEELRGFKVFIYSYLFKIKTYIF